MTEKNEFETVHAKDPDTRDRVRATQRLLNAELAVQALENKKDYYSEAYDAASDEAFTASEELVLMLLRHCRNQKMLSLVMDEMAVAVREGY